MNLRNMKRGEDTEQIKVMRWAAGAECRYPELRWLYHVPNGGSRDSAEAIKLKNLGVKRGVSDLCLPFPHGRYHGLYIEMKYGRNRTTKEQAEFLRDMRDAGHCVAVCHDAQSAAGLIEQYVNLPENGLVSFSVLKEFSCFWDEDDICHIKLPGPFA